MTDLDCERILDLLYEQDRGLFESFQTYVNSRTEGTGRIAAERQRQRIGEGFDSKYDEGYVDGELATAAACYAVSGLSAVQVVQADTGKDAWPWGTVWDKRSKHSRIRRLEVAGALVAAEIDRLLEQEKAE